LEGASGFKFFGKKGKSNPFSTKKCSVGISHVKTGSMAAI
jgi:hypothetical protein